MRIAQITDLHLRHHLHGPCPGPDRRARLMATLFPRALEQIAAHRPDLIAVTGDLADMPQLIHRPLPDFPPNNPDYWRRLAARDYELIRDCLEQTGLPWMVLPGNHDDIEAFWQVFDRADNIRDIAGHRVVRFCDHEYEGHVPRRFDPERRRFDQVLADDASPPQVHLQHYLIEPENNEGYPHSYAEAKHIARRIAASGRVRLALSGHYHQGTDRHDIGDTAYYVGPAFCVSTFPWRLYDLTDDGITMRQFELGRDAQPARPAVFLDRDGVIGDTGSYRDNWQRFRLLDGAAAAIRTLQEAGFATPVLSNQNAIGRGYYPPPVVHMTNDVMCRLLAEQGVETDAVYFARGETDPDRAVLPELVDHGAAKPSPHMIHRAIDDMNLIREGSWLIGDRPSDIQCAVNAGIAPILVRTGHGRRHEEACRAAWPDVIVVDDIAQAARVITDKGKRSP